MIATTPCVELEPSRQINSRAVKGAARRGVVYVCDSQPIPSGRCGPERKSLNVRHFIVPVDGSTHAWRAVETAIALAEHCNGRVEVVQVIFDPEEEQQVERDLRVRIGNVESADVSVVPLVSVASDPDDAIAGEIFKLVKREPSATVVLASQGRGRSAAVVGSVTEDLLRRVDGPVVVVGPQSHTPDFSNPMIVTLDGSDFSEAALPIAASWSNHLGPKPTLLRVVDSPASGQLDDAEIDDYLSSKSALLSTLSKHKVPHTLRHSRDVGRAVCAHAESIDASLIVTSTHGHTGLPRFVLGSTAAAFVRDAPCPVLLVRPAHAAPTESLPRGE